MLLALIGVAVGLIGWGVSATFTDGATATQNIKVGTFGIAIASTDGNGVVVGKTVTCSPADILSSASGTSTCGFKITNTGSIPAQITIAVAGPAAPFASLQAPVLTPVTVPVGGLTYTAGLSWPELFNPQLGQSYSVAYTVSATG